MNSRRFNKHRNSTTLWNYLSKCFFININYGLCCPRVANIQNNNCDNEENEMDKSIINNSFIYLFLHIKYITHGTNTTKMPND